MTNSVDTGPTAVGPVSAQFVRNTPSITITVRSIQHLNSPNLKTVIKQVCFEISGEDIVIVFVFTSLHLTLMVASVLNLCFPIHNV